MVYRSSRIGRGGVPLIGLLGGAVSWAVSKPQWNRCDTQDDLEWDTPFIYESIVHLDGECKACNVSRATAGGGRLRGPESPPGGVQLTAMSPLESVCSAGQDDGEQSVYRDKNAMSKQREQSGSISIILDQVTRAWASTKGVEQRRISLAVVRTLSSLQRIAVSASVSEDTPRMNDNIYLFTRVLAGSFFITLMLEHASSGRASAEFREETSKYITAVMKDRDIAASFLSTSGNTNRLFQALCVPDENSECHLDERVWNSMKNIDDIPLKLESIRDLDVVVSNVGLYRQNEYTRRIALRMFRWWCQHEGPKKEGNHAILVKSVDCLSTAANAVSGSDTSSKMDIVKCMRYMVEYLSDDLIHHVLHWMWPLLCFAADGVGSQDWDLVNEALDTFTACIEKGVCPSSHLIDNSALPLLYSISRDLPMNRLDVAVRLAECIGALARSKSSMSQAQKISWAELFVSWLVKLDPRKGDMMISGKTLIESNALSESVVDALASLASDPSTNVLQIAHLWLADLIIHMSRMATPYSKVEVPRKQTDADSSSWWSWVPFTSQTKPSADQSQTMIEKEEAQAVADLAEKMLGQATVSSQQIEPVKAHIETNSSWWNYYFRYPWGRHKDEGNQDFLPKKESVEASDPELSLYINASPVGPVYARSVARRLLEISGNVFNVESELSQSIDENMSPLTAAAYGAAAETVNKEVADNALGQALKVLSALASGSSDNRKWLLVAGLPRLLQIIANDKGQHMQHGTENATESPKDAAIPVKLQRQISRLLALLSIEISGSESIVRNNFVPWLQFLAASEDCKVSSNAAKALLHVEAAHKSRLLVSTMSDDYLLEVSRRMAKKPHELPSAQIQEPLGQHLGKQMMCLGIDDKQDLFIKQKHRETIWLDLSQDRLTFHDGVHLLSPLAKHHEVMAQNGIQSTQQGTPDMDIVFVHGIRGGAFITWRQQGAFSRGGARGNVDHSVCWPAAWLAPKFPNARMITVEYAAPATWWEGESLPLYATVNNLAERLTAAGIGSRPVIFICHSMGGIIVKEIIGQGTKKDALPALRKISKASVGAVFYSVPHAGSKLADLGWTLRYLGASPSRAVAHLKTDPHLHEMNSVIRDMCRRGKLQVLSFSEGLPTKFSYVSTHVVPHESAYPGYGEFHVLADHDHITACKPRDTNDASFESLVRFLSKIQADIHRE